MVATRRIIGAKLTDKGILDMIEEVEELRLVNEFLDDEDATRGLVLLRKVIKKPDVPRSEVQEVINELQAIATQCQIKGKFYIVLKPGKSGSDEYKRKHLYLTMQEALESLVAALKYTARPHQF